MTEKELQDIYRRRGQDPMLALSSVGNSKAAKRNKMGAKKTSYDGHVFDSAGEAKRYQELKVLVACGEIFDLTLQPKFELQAKFTDSSGKKQRAMTYTADFQYWTVDAGGNKSTCVEEFKGHRTQPYMMRKKLFLKLHPEIVFLEMHKGGSR